jgi:hypothetical protein
LEPLLKHLPILLVGRVFYSDGVVTLADFTALLVFALPSSGISTTRGGKQGQRQTLSDHPASNSLSELDYYNAMSTQRHKFGYQP